MQPGPVLRATAIPAPRVASPQVSRTPGIQQPASQRRPAAPIAPTVRPAMPLPPFTVSNAVTRRMPAQPPPLAPTIKMAPRPAPQMAPAVRMPPPPPPLTASNVINKRGSSVLSPPPNPRRAVAANPTALRSPFKQPGASRIAQQIQQEEDVYEEEAGNKPRAEKKDYTIQIAAGVGALIVIGALWLLLSGKAEKRMNIMIGEANEVLEKAQKQVKNNEFEKAQSTYKDFLSNSRFRDFPDKERDKVKGALSKIQSRMEKEEEAQRKLEPILAKSKNADKEQFPDIIEELIGFIKDYGETTFAQKANEEVSLLRQKKSEEKKANANELFAKVRIEADELYNKGDMNGALEKYRAFAKEYPDMAGPLKNKINSEMKAIKKEMDKKK
ncbi:MAG: hypothetical protein V1701_01445 [Planctomycetota bacterium]